MPTVYEGDFATPPGRFAIIAARFNRFVVEQLVQGALDAFKRHGVADDAIDVAWVPGSFEIPLVAKKLAGSGGYVAVICLGALIRGATPHFDHLASSVTGALQGIAVESGLPVINGVLTTESIEQALERSGTKAGNKGYDAAVVAVEMASVLRQVAGE